MTNTPQKDSPPGGVMSDDRILRTAIENVLMQKVMEKGERAYLKCVPGFVRGENSRWVHTAHIDNKGRLRIEHSTTDQFTTAQLVRVCEIFGVSDNEMLDEMGRLANDGRP